MSGVTWDRAGIGLAVLGCLLGVAWIVWAVRAGIRAQLWLAIVYLTAFALILVFELLPG